MGWLFAIVLWVASESEKVRPSDPPPAAPQTRMKLVAAGGDCAGAQIVVRGPLRGLRANANGLPLQISRVATIALEFPSGPDGQTGEWPDALIPARDLFFGEERNAFPVDVAAGRAQAIFVEACAERGKGPSRQSGSVRLAWNGGSREVPVELRVRAFDLPRTPALVTAFGFSGYSAARGHQRPAQANRELTALYDRIAVRRGINLYGGTQDAPEYELHGDDVRIHWKSYDDEIAEFVQSWSAIELRMPRKLNRLQRRSWRRAWVEHFRQRGWLEKLFVYVQDEPPQKEFPQVEAKAHEVLEDAPEVTRLVTTAWSTELPSVNLFVPVINCLERDPSCPRAVSREKYPRLWWYQSCMSHGCGWNGKPVLAPMFRGWPSYMIDAPATAARAMGALAFANGVAGELYFMVNYAYTEGDPWKSQWAFGGNGDGTLYYPGTPERIGGKHDVPVESLRIVQIARSIADYGYLALLASLGDAQLAREEAHALAPSLKGFSRDPRAYEAMRERVASRIEARLASRKASAE